MSNDRPSPKQYEAWLIQLLRQLFERANFKVEDHKKVGELPLEIDMIVISTGAEKPPNFAELPPLFHYFRQHNVMELKTEKDRLEIADLLKLHAYGWLYMAKESLANVAEVTLTALVHHLNPAILQALPTLGYRQVSKDVFRCDAHMLSYVIAFENPQDEGMPEELQAFSNPARRQPIILNELRREQNSQLLKAFFDLYESEVYKLMTLRQETIDRMIEAVGREKFLAAFRKEEFLAALSKEDHLAALRKEDHLAALSNEDMVQWLLAKVGSEQLSKIFNPAKSN